MVADKSKCAPLFPNRLSPRSGVAKPVSRCCHVLLVPLLLTAVAHSQDVHVRVSPDVKTGIEGTTEFPTIQMALDHHPFPKTSPDGKLGRVLIEIEPGVYHERVNVTQNHPNITLIGKGKSPADVVITNSLNAKQAGGTFFTETVEVNGPGFEADNLTFENTAGNTGQAVAIVVRADRSVFKHCRFLGHQDTLFADYGRQYYVDSYIEGGTDFIFGNATAVFDHSEIHANAPGYLTAQSRTSADQTTGFVILDSNVTSGIASELDTTGQPKETISLGRPWRPYSRVVYIDTWLPADVLPQGWSLWGRNAEAPKAYYAEFKSTGPGARPSDRVAWSHQLDAPTATQFHTEVFLAGSDHWDARSEARGLP
jgi:pectinesterase